MSTAFSGVDTPGLAAGVLSQSVADLIATKLGEDEAPPKFAHLSAVEWDSQCQSELLAGPHSPKCLFGDISEFWADGIRQWAKHVTKTPMAGLCESLKPVILKGRACRTHAWCLRHQRDCELVPANTHIAGTPCVDESVIGKRRGALDGSSSMHFMIWAALRRALQEPDCPRWKRPKPSHHHRP